jgi:crossover junction endodeoxyribonuclease RuvC
MRILGIDPGSRVLGLGCVELNARSLRWIGHGAIRIPADEGLAGRLRAIVAAVERAVKQWGPSAVAVEEVFFAKNPKSALLLGQARGAALAVAASHGFEIFEYSATKVKQSVTGSGRAEKEQVQRMVEALLKSTLPPNSIKKADAADALAVALCHIQFAPRSNMLVAAEGRRVKTKDDRTPQRTDRR